MPVLSFPEVTHTERIAGLAIQVFTLGLSFLQLDGIVRQFPGLGTGWGRKVIKGFFGTEHTSEKWKVVMIS